MEKITRLISLWKISGGRVLPDKAGDTKRLLSQVHLSKERHYAGYRASDAHESGTENAGGGGRLHPGKSCRAWKSGFLYQRHAFKQSITGAYVKTLITKKDAMPSDYEACSKACYEHVFQIDQHLPFTTPKVQKLVETIKPEYLTHELMSYGRSEHEIKLVMQRAALKGKNL